MEVALRSVTKRFGREVVFREVEHVFAAGSRTALLGPNGSGKSTLLQVIGGALSATSGTVLHQLDGRVIDPEAVYRQVAFATPYLGLYEDLSLRDTLAFHRRFKPFRPGLADVDVARAAYLDKELDKPVRQFSSGMKQRLKLVLAVMSDVPLLLLDEPTSNLDARGTTWSVELLQAHVEGRTLVVASNRVEAETALCTAQLDVLAWKPGARG
ncbi:MAG: ABC transporter ATP-binding protein [Flavobacteriales bacterium]|jgi:ABC-type multidrug transport system ATPase subunit|nr:ABC transporter ATP-binding protein [Flavobacteriales bacterium]MBK7942357.1 ABC transporter ATP-binding protein [Flavobacteriales bacterium]MBK8948173.1 ABC transporter ATP-binding protein [Flavobacteriales bacterium]MBK9699242.1 ABC transporter ATP-binding protein [Flavobacteriales bacterium]